MAIDFGGKHEGEAIARDSELAPGRESYGRDFEGV